MDNLVLLFPEMLLSGLALVLLLADLWIPFRLSKILYHLGLICAVITLGMVGRAYSDPGRFQGVGTLWAVDALALFFKVLVLLTTILTLLITMHYVPGSKSQAPGLRHLGSFTAL